VVSLYFQNNWVFDNFCGLKVAAQMRMEVSSQLQQAYTNQYDPSGVAWRMLGAKHKAANVQALARHIEFNNVLEVGCGEGSILWWLGEWGFSEQLYGLEISQSGIDLANTKQIKGLQDIGLFDGYQIPYPDGHFDLVICSHVLEHVEHPRLLLREIKRVSKYQIFEVPIDFSFYVDRKLAHFLAYGHINIFTPGLFRFLLRSEQFVVKHDVCFLYPSDLLRHLYRHSSLGFWLQRAKQAVIGAIPYLRGIKPQSYAVLTESTGGDLRVF
jgi:ubiquinone/menaquinone biosynthesis C-methylase UbiE